MSRNIKHNLFMIKKAYKPHLRTRYITPILLQLKLSLMELFTQQRKLFPNQFFSTTTQQYKLNLYIRFSSNDAIRERAKTLQYPIKTTDAHNHCHLPTSGSRQQQRARRLGSVEFAKKKYHKPKLQLHHAAKNSATSWIPPQIKIMNEITSKTSSKQARVSLPGKEEIDKGLDGLRS
uniref:Uncharacterized protein n=1 Tax=Arundo donax TaxID=35708 RepID=A0A0A9FSB5_ARUDO